MKVRIDQEFDNLTTPPLKRELLFSSGEHFLRITPFEPDARYARFSYANLVTGIDTRTERPLNLLWARKIVERLGFPTDCDCELAKPIGPRKDKPQKYVPHDFPGVYFLQGPSGPIKIGVARWSIGSRMAEIQFMCPDRLELIGCIRGAGQKDEKALHRKFSHLRLHGEWFEPARELLNFIATEAHHAT